MHANTSDQKFGYLLNLRQVSINLIQTLQLLLDKFTDETFGVPICEIHCLIKAFCQVESALSRKGKYNARKKFHLLDFFKCFLERN